MNSLIKKLLAPRHIEYLAIDRDFTILETSVGVHRFTDSPKDIIEGKDVRKAFPELIGLEDVIYEILQGNTKEFELKTIGKSCKNGNFIYIDLYIMADDNEAGDNHNKNDKKLLIFLEDVTEKMIMEQALVQRGNEACLLLSALETSKDYIEKILKSIADALIVTDLSGKIKQVNKVTQELFGYSEAELIGQSIALIIPENTTKTHQSLIPINNNNKDILYEEKLLKNIEVIGQKKTGDKITVSFSCAAIQTNKEDDLEDIVYIGRDITEKHKSADKIQQLNEDLQKRAIALEIANKELEEFSHSVAHDLRNPLNRILNYNQIFIDDYCDQIDADGLECLYVVRQSAQRMSQLIADLLRLSQVTRGKIQLEKVNLSALATSIANELQQRDLHRQIEVIIPENITATGDSQLLRIVLENLLGNAWKFTGKQSQSRIEFGVISTENNHVNTYFVRDNGAGFDMSKYNRLFMAFERLHEKNDFEGTGIGLATVKRIINRHGGEIWAESLPGQGSTFYFTFNHKIE